MGVFISRCYPQIRISTPSKKKMTITDPKEKKGPWKFFFENCIKVPRIFEKRALIFAVNRTSSSSQSHLSHYFSIQLESVFFKKIGFLKNGLQFFFQTSIPINYHIEKENGCCIGPLSFGNW